MNTYSILPNRKSVESFSATITLGLKYSFSGGPIHKEDIYAFIVDFQEKMIQEKGVYLSASISKCFILLSGQREKHLQIKFINYPKSPLKKEELKEYVEKLTRLLMDKFDQKRIVIEFSDETVMFETTDAIDPNIIAPKAH